MKHVQLKGKADNKKPKGFKGLQQTPPPPGGMSLIIHGKYVSCKSLITKGICLTLFHRLYNFSRFEKLFIHMIKKLSLFIASLFLLFGASTANAKEYGVILNDDDPWIISTGYSLYICEWYGGDITFWEDDAVILTDPDAGFNFMIGVEGLSKGQKAYVWCDELDY
jgi:hypothetical protein